MPNWESSFARLGKLGKFIPKIRKILQNFLGKLYAAEMQDLNIQTFKTVLALSHTRVIYFVYNIPFLKPCCEKRDCSMIHQWFINSKSLNHEMRFFFRKAISTNLDEFCEKFQLIWLLLHSLCSFCGSGPSCSTLSFDLISCQKLTFLVACE